MVIDCRQLARMFIFIFIALLLSMSGLVVNSGQLDGLVVVVMTHRNNFHESQTERRLLEIEEDLQALHVKDYVLLGSHEINVTGAPWTIVPLLPPLALRNGRWYLFLTESTQVDFAILERSLSHYDSREKLFLGHGLSDEEYTIIHHFAPPNSLLYPHIASGFLLSGPALLEALENVQHFEESFNIDPEYELALFLKYGRLTKNEIGPSPPPAPPTSTLLTHLPSLCLSPPPFPADGTCATVHEESIPECHESAEVTVDQVHFAVKTCSKFHSTRLPVVQKTWALDVGVASLVYYSDKEDEEYSTVYSGVPNTEKGHCGKTIAIVRKFHSLAKTKPLKWLMIADDDTLLSVPRLLRLLRCYDYRHPILLGEVYGYRAYAREGYSFVTGGGGIVLSVGAVNSFMESGMDCPSIDHPDDMYLGNVAKTLGWDVVHSSLFHQSQPPSFPDQVLQVQESISFHRHSPLNPLQVYAQYLKDFNLEDGPTKKEEL